MTVQIMCILKDNGNHYNPHEAVTYYHWIGEPQQPNGRLYSRLEMVAFLETGNTAFVKSGDNSAYCKVVSNGRIKFLQTYSDSTPTDNLLKLPECPHI